jgi:hypothetical protein
MTHRLSGFGYDLKFNAARRQERQLRDGEPCDHPQCLAHHSHPCDGCGRIGGVTDTRTILVGEANPYGGDPAYALYPLPVNSAGGRLCRLIMGLEVRDYLQRFNRRNLCATKWSMPEARRTAGEILGAPSGCTVVLFGAKVCSAFDRGFNPYTIERDPGLSRTLVILPHPSGLSRAWNEPGSFERARRVLEEAGVLP